MYSERIAEPSCNASQVQNQNQMSCGRCEYHWIDNRGLTIDRIVCPRCGSKIVRRGLVQSGKKKQPRSAIDELMEILEFTTGDKKYQSREYKN